MTIAFLPWPTSIYIDQSQHAISIYMVRSPSEIQLCADTTSHQVYMYLLRTQSAGPSHRQSTRQCGAIAKSFRTSLSQLRILHKLCQWASVHSYLACGHELKRAERDLEVGGVRLEVVESSRDAALELGRALARRARGRDLVEGAHGCGGCR